MFKRSLPAALLLVALIAPCGAAQGAKPKEAEAEPVPPPVGVFLGEYYLREARGSEAVKVRLSFSLYAEVPAGDADVFVSRVERYRHRIRDQVLTAVRMSDLADYSEPKLERLRRRILSRLKRVAPHLKTDRLLFAEFEYLTE